MKTVVSTASSSLLWVLLAALILQLLSSVGSKILSLELFIRSFQLILHLPVYVLVKFPANCLFFIEISIKIVLFDFLEEFLDWESIEWMRVAKTGFEPSG